MRLVLKKKKKKNLFGFDIRVFEVVVYTSSVPKWIVLCVARKKKIL